MCGVTVKGECVRAEFKARFKNSGALAQKIIVHFKNAAIPTGLIINMIIEL